MSKTFSFISFFLQILKQDYFLFSPFTGYILFKKRKGPCAKVWKAFWIILSYFLKRFYKGPDPGDLLLRASMSQVNSSAELFILN